MPVALRILAMGEETLRNNIAVGICDEIRLDAASL
jgi:hypothetical protein